MSIFLIGVGLWFAAGRYFTIGPVIAKALSRWGNILLPVALIAVGSLILREGGAVGLTSRPAMADSRPGVDKRRQR